MTTLAAKVMLERSPLFRGLSPEILARIASRATQRRYANDDAIFMQGDPGDALYAVVSGRIRISAGTADGKELFLNIMEPGDTFGEIALLDGGERLRWTSGFVEDAALLDAEARLAKRLVNLAQVHGQRVDGGTTLRISQEALASFLGLSRQVVNQHLQGWRAQGWVRLGRGIITVRDEAALKSRVRGASR